jgi:hypothetical protein
MFQGRYWFQLSRKFRGRIEVGKGASSHSLPHPEDRRKASPYYIRMGIVCDDDVDAGQRCECLVA